MCVPHTGSEAWTRGLGLKVKQAWHPWKVNQQVTARLLIKESGSLENSNVSCMSQVLSTGLFLQLAIISVELTASSSGLQPQACICADVHHYALP